MEPGIPNFEAVAELTWAQAMMMGFVFYWVLFVVLYPVRLVSGFVRSVFTLPSGFRRRVVSRE